MDMFDSGCDARTIFLYFYRQASCVERIIERMKSNFDFKVYVDRREGGGKETFSEMCRNNEIS